MPDVQPYSIFDVAKGSRRDNDYYRLLASPVSTVAMGAVNFAQGTVPIICDGTIGYIERVAGVDSRTQFKQGTNCAGGNGTSGSAVVVQKADAGSAILGFVGG